jgi:hypothetical protein
MGLLILGGFARFIIHEVITEYEAANNDELLDDGLPYRMLEESSSVHCIHFEESKVMSEAP